MGTSQDDIRRWLQRGKEEEATHLIVVSDGFDREEYPVYVHKGESAQDVHAEYAGKEMQRVMEVYSYGRNLEEQLAERRSFHLD